MKSSYKDLNNQQTSEIKKFSENNTLETRKRRKVKKYKCKNKNVCYI